MKNIVSTTAVSVLAALAVVLSACAPQAEAPPANVLEPAPSVETTQPVATPAIVEIDGQAFVPASIEISAGGSVRWVNRDPVPHTVTGAGDIASEQLAEGDEYSKVFPSIGTYDYYCSIHPSMKGTVVVK